MSVLRNLEDKIAGIVEGTFGRVFRAEVKPIELAHKLTREMDAARTVSVSRTYVPNRYVVWLSPRDREQYAGIEQDVIDELAGHLLEHARANEYVMVTAPKIELRTDDELSLGEFGIQVGNTAPPEATPPARAEPEPEARRHGARTHFPDLPDEHRQPRMGETMVYSTANRHREALDQSSARPRGRTVLSVEGKRIVVPDTGATIGRSRDCEIMLGDANVSRRHAELTPDGEGGWIIRDLGSTNGLRVNGRPTGRNGERVGPGDRVEIGTVPAILELG